MTMGVAGLRKLIHSALPANSFRARLASGAFWTLFGAFLFQGINAIASFVTARILGKTLYGEFGMVVNTLGTLGILAGTSLGSTANRYVAAHRSQDPARAGHILSLCFTAAILCGLLMTGAVLWGADFLASKILAAPELAHYLRVASPVLILGAISGIQIGALAGFEVFKKTAQYRGISATIGATITIIATIKLGLVGAVVGLVANSAADAVLCCILFARTSASHGVRWLGASPWVELPVLWEYAIPSLLSGVLAGPVMWAAAAIFVHQPGGYGELGVFNAAGQWRTLIVFIPSAVGTSLLPVLANLYTAGDVRRIIRALKAHIILSAVTSLCIAIPLIAAGRWIMASYGKDYASGWPALTFLAVAAVLQCLNNVIGQALASCARMWTGFLLNGLWAVEILVATIFLKHYGAVGLAIAYMVSYLLHTIQVGAAVKWLLKKVAPSDDQVRSMPSVENSDGATAAVNW